MLKTKNTEERNPTKCEQCDRKLFYDGNILKYNLLNITFSLDSIPSELSPIVVRVTIKRTKYFGIIEDVIL